MDQHQLSNQVDGELLHDLEEKMEVARIQLKIYNDLQQVADVRLRDQARAELDTQLYTVSEVCAIIFASSNDSLIFYLVVQSIREDVWFVRVSVGHHSRVKTQRPDLDQEAVGEHHC